MTTKIAPTVQQVSPSLPQALATLAAAGSRAVPTRVTADRLGQDKLALMLDAGTAATVMQALREAATEADVAVRRARADGMGDLTIALLAAKAHRLRTVTDTVDAEDVRVHGPYATVND